MINQYQLSSRARLAWIVALLMLPIVSAGTIFGLTDDTLVEGEDSTLAQRYASATVVSAPAEDATFPTRFGVSGGATTLVLYDDTGSNPGDAELYGVAAANLATHFGEAQIMAVDDYTAGAMAAFDAVVYIGTDYEATLPTAFVRDVRQGGTPVLWVDQNIDELVGDAEGALTDFVVQYGWNPVDGVPVESAKVENVRYKDRHVHRHTEGTDMIYSPRLVDTAAVDLLASAVCGDPADPEPCISGGSDTEVPWALRSGNLTYVTELPLDYIDVNDVYLIFADLYYDLLAPDAEPVQQAAVRLEDVGPEADPDDLRAVADYLHGAGVPFQVAVMPVHIARTPDGEGWYGLSLLDRPKVAEALKYMQKRGGTLIQHGTTHQFGTMDNPYSGRTGEDYEFYEFGCTSDPRPPYTFGKCENDSYIRQVGPVAEDHVEQHVERIEHGRQIMVDAGLGEPQIFETPHYAGSVNAYAAISQVYDARYEQSDYFQGIVSGHQSAPGGAYSQHFPYKVHDIYGATVYPENLGNITETEQNNHAVRDPEFLVERAEANLIVRESTASFFFHPYLDLEYLKDTVEGIEKLGYTFVTVDDLR